MLIWILGHHDDPVAIVQPPSSLWHEHLLYKDTDVF